VRANSIFQSARTTGGAQHGTSRHEGRHWQRPSAAATAAKAFARRTGAEAPDQKKKSEVIG